MKIDTEKINAILQEKGWTKSEFAKKLNWNDGYLNIVLNMEKLGNPLEIRHVKRMAKILEVPVESIIVMTFVSNLRSETE